MEATFSNWRTLNITKPSGLPPVVWQTKITKTKVIPLYRMATPKGETDEVFVLYADSFCNKSKRYTNKGVFPYTSLMPLEDMKPELINEQMSIDMVNNCESIGVEISDGDKEVCWKPFVPAEKVAPAFPLSMESIAKYYIKAEKPVKDDEDEKVEVAQVTATTETVSNPVPEMVTVIEGMETKRSEKSIGTVTSTPVEPKQIITYDSTKSVVTNEPSYHYEPKAKGQKGRPRKVYDDPVFDALVRSVPKTIKCQGCGKEVIIAPLNIIDRANNLKVEVSKLLADYRCRSC